MFSEPVSEYGYRKPYDLHPDFFCYWMQFGAILHDFDSFAHETHSFAKDEFREQDEIHVR